MKCHMCNPNTTSFFFIRISLTGWTSRLTQRYRRKVPPVHSCSSISLLFNLRYKKLLDEPGFVRWWYTKRTKQSTSIVLIHCIDNDKGTFLSSFSFSLVTPSCQSFTIFILSLSSSWIRSSKKEGWWCVKERYSTLFYSYLVAHPVHS